MNADDMVNVIKWVDPDQWYCVVDNLTNELRPWTMTHSINQAKKAAASLGGSVVIVETRIGANPDEEYINPVK